VVLLSVPYIGVAWIALIFALYIRHIELYKKEKEKQLKIIIREFGKLAKET